MADTLTQYFFDSRNTTDAPFITCPISVGDQLFIENTRYDVHSISISGNTAMITLSSGKDFDGNPVVEKTLTLKINN